MKTKLRRPPQPWRSRRHAGPQRLRRRLRLRLVRRTEGDGTIASQMIFGGPPEFKTRADGIPGLKENYGVEFGKYTVTDTGGPVTVNALKQGQVDAADLFTTDPAIEANDFVILEDPKANFAAQNIVPIINKEKATDGVKETLNEVSAKLTTEGVGGADRQGGQRQGGPDGRRRRLARPTTASTPPASAAKGRPSPSVRRTSPRT